MKGKKVTARIERFWPLCFGVEEGLFCFGAVFEFAGEEHVTDGAACGE